MFSRNVADFLVQRFQGRGCRPSGVGGGVRPSLGVPDKNLLQHNRRDIFRKILVWSLNTIDIEALP